MFLCWKILRPRSSLMTLRVRMTLPRADALRLFIPAGPRVCLSNLTGSVHLFHSRVHSHGKGFRFPHARQVQAGTADYRFRSQVFFCWKISRPRLVRLRELRLSIPAISDIAHKNKTPVLGCFIFMGVEMAGIEPACKRKSYRSLHV